ncbi:MAG TPA: phosphatase PAP2 family protein [Acidimicrobiales bacterium]|nr:phosphatase PAP2 family protein [Acidimicrobiales bacterium]
MADGWQDQVGQAGRRVGVPMAIGLAVLCGWSIAAGEAVTGPLETTVGRWDLELAQSLEAGRTSVLTRLTGAATVLADSVTVAVLWAAAVVVTAWRTKRWELPSFFLCAIGGEKLTYLVTSLVVSRPRPPVEPLGHVFATHSWPSGHVGAALTLYGGVALAVVVAGRRRGLGAALAVLAVVATLVVAFSRCYRGHHYVSDVVWGALLGAAWLVLAWWAALRQRPASDPIDRSAPITTST